MLSSVFVDRPRLAIVIAIVTTIAGALALYSIPQIVAFCSDFTELAPGDVIATGTPEGVGHRRTPPLWMKPGDVLEVEITGIGVLRNRIVDEA